jgi:hypothetical protein
VVLGVVIALVVGATLLATEGETPAPAGLPPYFPPETGFANDTSNCPTGAPATRDPEAATIISLLAASRSAVDVIDRSAKLRSLTVEPGGALRFTLFAGGSRNAVSIQAPRAFEDGAASRLIVSSYELPGIPPGSTPTLDLTDLSIGPTNVRHKLSEEHGTPIEQITLLTLFHEGCHLVWGAIAKTPSGETLNARINNTTGELRWSPDPIPEQRQKPR